MKYLKLFEGEFYQDNVKNNPNILSEPSDSKSPASGIKLKDYYIKKEGEQRKLAYKEKMKARWEKEAEKEKLLIKQTNIIIDNFFKSKNDIEEKIKKHFGIENPYTRSTGDGMNRQNPLPCAVDIKAVPYKQNDEINGHTWDLSDDKKVEHYRNQGKMLMNLNFFYDYHIVDYVLGYAYFLKVESGVGKIETAKNSAKKIIQISDNYPAFIEDLPNYEIIIQALEPRTRYDQVHFQFQVRMKNPIKIDTKEVMYAINQE